jgi:hypothetical protein
MFVGRLGIEGLVMFKRETQFDAENYTISVPGSASPGARDITISVFDKVPVLPSTTNSHVTTTLACGTDDDWKYAALEPSN